ncbi:Esf1p [Sugiyamaella lignohabitans]|uniref:Esf1p n=1 Tax=Sugiyamaella lignohabitans TaxID=796027 RepID=A0A167DEI8_9ASCO|nr:Esf1p [Sugiyamaella lignohabitans]ANB12825.1 Esf1p [Sugiyamaella lignohabitans]
MARKSAAGGAANKSNPRPKAEAVTSDPRFASVHNDPRFNLPKRKNIKSDLDSRFKDAISKEKEFQKVETIDKYGRKISRNNTRKELERYYNLDDEKKADSEESESEQEEKATADIQEDSESESESSDESDDEEKLAKSVTYDRARGEGPEDSESSSSDDSSSDDSDDSDDDVFGDEEDYDEEEEEGPGVKPKVELGDETSSFAVVNMDWDNIRAVDLMATLSSFAPARGRIVSVSIYPSEYGKEKMAQEELQGPAKELFVDSKKKSKSKKPVSDEESSDEEEINEKTIIQEDKGEEVDGSKLRKYQLQRLKYYYAVVKCDSVATAKNIYDNVDGTEYESTANFFDLRYIPEGMDFEDAPRDECTKIPSNYKPNNFVTDALQHSKVKLTWDETPSERLQLASKAFSQKEIDDMDFKAYLASDSEDEEEAGEDAREKYLSLLGPMANKLNGKDGKDSDGEDDVDMEITFTPGLDEAGKAQEEEKEETTIEKYRRKEKERRKKRMEKFKESKHADDDEEAVTKPDIKQTNKKNKKGAKVDDKKAAEMELLLMDDNLDNLQAKKSDQIDRNVKKSKKSKKLQEAEAAETGFDMQDERFKDLFENPDYAIDTTVPQFKKTDGMEKVMSERRKRSQNTGNGSASKSSSKRKVDSVDGKDELLSLVEKVKRRAKK